MWLLFHRNAKTRPVRGGNSLVEVCPECGKRATFVEVEVSESFGMFFVDLVGDKERAYRCGACGEVFDLRDQPSSDATSTPAKPAPPTKPLAELEREQQVAEQRRREDAQARAAQIEDELAALKKRLGR